ncbi:hypothetical protein LguiB_013516 [Lonicera macranthoides]
MHYKKTIMNLLVDELHFPIPHFYSIRSSEETFDAHQLLDVCPKRDFKAIINNGLVVPYWEYA